MPQPPAEIAFRPATRGDTDAIHSLHRRCETHDRAPFATALREIEEGFDRPYFDPGLDSRVAVATDGRVVGFASIGYRPSGERQERAFLDGMVDPDHRRRGIGTALFHWQVQRGTERLGAAGNDLPKFLRAHAWEWLTDAHALYQRHGFEAARWFDDMLRPLDDLPEVPEPTGVDIVPWDPDRSEEVRLAHNEAFADHWGSTPMPPESWAHWLTSHGIRTDLSFIAVAGSDSGAGPANTEGEVVGYAINGVFPDNFAVTGRQEGWIETLGVRKAWRGLGVASALIAASLLAFSGEGLSHGALGVD
ncbi:MAG: GNAT family N-acetyltransferase, partial [Acidimicrobiia bacterium]